jgi:hypothetical protein
VAVGAPSGAVEASGDLVGGDAVRDGEVAEVGAVAEVGGDVGEAGQGGRLAALGARDDTSRAMSAYPIPARSGRRFTRSTRPGSQPTGGGVTRRPLRPASSSRSRASYALSVSQYRASMTES